MPNQPERRDYRYAIGSALVSAVLLAIGFDQESAIALSAGYGVGTLAGLLVGLEFFKPGMQIHKFIQE